MTSVIDLDCVEAFLKLYYEFADNVCSLLCHFSHKPLYIQFQGVETICLLIYDYLLLLIVCRIFFFCNFIRKLQDIFVYFCAVFPTSPYISHFILQKYTVYPFIINLLGISVKFVPHLFSFIACIFYRLIISVPCLPQEPIYCIYLHRTKAFKKSLS